MIDPRPLIRAAVVVGVLAGAFGAGWTVNGWRMSSTIDRIKADHSDEVAEATRKGAAKLALAVKERDALASTLSGIDAARSAELEKQRAEINRLRLAVGTGAVGLRVVGAVCPPPAGPTPPGAAPTGSMDPEPTAVLDSVAGSAYLALRENITVTEHKLSACQDALRAFAATTP